MAFATSISCPSCGVAVDSVTAHTRSAQCPHCGNWIYLSGNGWVNAGTFEHALDAPSILRVGRRGRFAEKSGHNRDFFVAGRVRLSYPDGYWDEWWLEFSDGVHHWLEEDDGRYRLHSPVEFPVDVTSVQAAKVGTQLLADGKNWFITERVDTVLTGMQGALPMVVQPNDTMICLDLMGNGQQLSLEASDTDVSVTSSEKIAGSDLLWAD